jgi:hypothetical protein
MESLIIITILCKLIILLICFYLLYEFIKYIGFDRTIFVLSIVLHFIGGYLMFFS